MEYLFVKIDDLGGVMLCSDIDAQESKAWAHVNDIARDGWVFRSTVQKSNKKQYAILLMERQAPTEAVDDFDGDDEDAVRGDRLNYLNDVLRKQGGEF